MGFTLSTRLQYCYRRAKRNKYRVSLQTREVLDRYEVLQELIELNGYPQVHALKLCFEKESIHSKIISFKKGKYLHFQKNDEHWIVKFANTLDGKDAGAIEYVYALTMAQEAGINMMSVHLKISLNIYLGAGILLRKDLIEKAMKDLKHLKVVCYIPILDYRLWIIQI